MVGVIEEMDPATGEMKTYELDAKKESKEKGKAGGSDNKTEPSAAVAALAQQQTKMQADEGTRGGNNSTDPFPVIVRRWEDFAEWK